MSKFTIKCPTCGRITELSNGLFGSRGLPENYTCPMCSTVIDVAKAVAMSEERRKGLVSVIQYEGDNQTFVWKHPIENFNLGSQLIVHESQEAIFFRDGKALDVFTAGRYTLETQNLPLLQGLYSLPTNAETPFQCEVYFINKTVQMGIKWGTDSKVRMFDPATGLHVELGACGQFNLKVCDSRKLLIKLVGTAGGLGQSEIFNIEKQMTYNETANTLQVEVKTIMPKFRALIMTKVKSSLARIIKENNINILEIDEHLDLLSEKLRDYINMNLTEYGLVMPEFFVTTVMTPDEDPNFRRLKQQHADMYLKIRQEQILKAEAEASAERQFVEASTAARMKVISAQGDAEAYKIKAAAEAEEMHMKGYTYQQETARQVGLGAVQNINGIGGNGLSDIAGLGISLGALGSVMGMTRDALNPITKDAQEMRQNLGNAIHPEEDTWNCSCGNQNVTGKFCSQCGNKRPEPVETWDCTCGNKSIIGNFCNMCGAKKPEPPETWNCTCGNKNIIGNFCNMCGAKKPEEPQTWNCSCGNTDITGNFCNNCGKKRENS